MSRLVLFAFSSLALICLLGISARADGPPRPPDHPLFVAPPVSLSPSCGFIGSCARFDAIALQAGTIGLARGGGDPRFAALSGWTHASIAFLDLAEIGGAFGGHVTRDESGAFHTATAPGLLQAKLRVYPLPWQKISDRGGLQVGIAYQRSFVSEKLGAAEPPGFGVNTLSLLASRSFGPVDVDLGIAALVGGESDSLRRAVQVHGTAALRLFGLARPLAPDEQLRVLIQAVYRFPLPGDANPSDAYVLAGAEFQTHSGYRFGVAAGPYLLGSRAGGMGMFTFSVAWGQRYRNPLGEYWASKPAWIPKFWMDLFHVDPVLGPDGCIRTDPSPIGQRIIKCVGHPDPNDPKMIVLPDGRRYPVGTHAWIRNDGMLVTQRQEELGQLDPEETKQAIAAQLLADALRDRSDTEACRKLNLVLEQVQKSNIFAQAAAMEGLHGLAIADWINRTDACGLGSMGGGFLPIAALRPLKNGQLTYRPTPKKEDAAVHDQPVKPVKPGKLEIQGSAYQKEIDFAREEAAKGHDVVLRGSGAAGYDLIIDGTKWELKTLDQATKNAVRDKLDTKSMAQGRGRVIIDGRKVGLTTETAVDALGHQVNSDRMPSAIEVRILTVDGEVRWSQ